MILSSNFSNAMETMKFLIFVLQMSILNQTIFGLDVSNETEIYRDKLTNPCTKREDGFARDLASCKNYYYCKNGEAHRGICDQGYVFDAENELCVTQDQANVCFKCLPTKYYQLISVPKACSQYIQCFNGNPTLHICKEGLVFDGSNGIHQCNKPPSEVGCNREDKNDFEQSVCPAIQHEPIFYLDATNKSV